jgi:hypothetical protein
MSAPCGAEGSAGGGGSVDFGSTGGAKSGGGTLTSLFATAFAFNSAATTRIASSIGTWTTPFSLSTHAAVCNFAAHAA